MCVFRWDLKVETVSEVRMSGGREFQRLGAGRLKALEPLGLGWQKRWMVKEDWRVWEGV